MCFEHAAAKFDNKKKMYAWSGAQIYGFTQCANSALAGCTDAGRGGLGIRRTTEAVAPNERAGSLAQLAAAALAVARQQLFLTGQ